VKFLKGVFLTSVFLNCKEKPIKITEGSGTAIDEMLNRQISFLRIAGKK
jgi:hypothetical protein